MKSSKYKSIVLLSLLVIFLIIGSCRIIGPSDLNRPNYYLRYVSEIETKGYAYAVDVSGNYAFVADGVGGLKILDVTNPYYPTIFDSYESDGTVFDVKYGGDGIVYLASGSEGVEVIDAFQPFGPSRLGYYKTYRAFGLDYAGKYLYLADDMAGVRILNVENPFSIYQTSSKSVQGLNTFNTKLDWPYLYACSRYGLTALNVYSPNSPLEVFFKNLSYVYDVEVVTHLAYVAYEEGLVIYDLDKIDEPKEVGFCLLPATARAIVVRGDYAYLALGRSGLSIVNISNPTAPREVAYYQPASCEMNSIFMGGRYLYIANGEKGGIILECLSSI